jgi:uncharacterized repeat protein (TIGR04138 family)
MLSLRLTDDVVERIRALEPRFHEDAYVFVLAALEYCQRERKVRGHISGEELAHACRRLALEQFGLMARSVLSYWGIGATDHIGRIVFVLIEVGLLIQHPTDRIEDFEHVFDFTEVFEGAYPWTGVIGAG